MSPPWETLCTFASPAVRVALESEPALAEVLDTQLAAAEALEVSLALEPFLRRVAASLAAGDAPTARLRGLHAKDLRLATAAAHGDPRAVRLLEREHLGEVDRAIAKLGLSLDRAADAKQLVHEKLLVPRGDGLPKLADYDGSGPLSAWLRVVATRTALNVVRDSGPEKPTDAEVLERDLATHRGPDLEVLKASSLRRFKQVFEAALASLEPEQRLLLKQHHVDGVSAEKLGAHHGVHPVTMLRRLEKAREEIASRVRRTLLAEDGASRDEVAELLELLESRLDLSLSRVLGA